MVIDTDGSAFITKAEFDSLKNNFQAQIDNYNNSIDSKIDGAIAAYLSGVKVLEDQTEYEYITQSGGLPLNVGYTTAYTFGKILAMNSALTTPRYEDNTWGYNTFTSDPTVDGDYDSKLSCYPLIGYTFSYPGGPLEKNMTCSLSLKSNPGSASYYDGVTVSNVSGIYDTYETYAYYPEEFTYSSKNYSNMRTVGPKVPNDTAIRNNRSFWMANLPTGIVEDSQRKGCMRFLLKGSPGVMVNLPAMGGSRLGNKNYYLADGTPIFGWGETPNSNYGFSMIRLADDLDKQIHYAGEDILPTDIYIETNDTANVSKDGITVPIFCDTLKGIKIKVLKPINYFRIRYAAAKVYFWIENSKYEAGNWFRLLKKKTGILGEGKYFPPEINYDAKHGVYLPNDFDPPDETDDGITTLQNLGFENQNKVLFFDIPYTDSDKYYSLDLGMLMVDMYWDVMKIAPDLTHWVCQEGLHCDIKLYNKEGDLVGVQHPY